MRYGIAFGLLAGSLAAFLGVAGCATAPKTRDSEVAKLSPDASPAARELATRCDGGDLTACADLGYAYRRGNGVPKDSDHGAALYKRACDKNNPRGCGYYGVLLLLGPDASQAPRGVELLRASCAGKERIGCYNLGWALDHGKGTVKNQTEAGEHYREACDMGLMDGCSNLGFQAEFGRGRPVDAELALRYYTQACDGGDNASCAYRADFMMDGKVLTKNEIEAARIFEGLCKKDVPEGCAGWGSALLFGHGVKADTATGIAILNKYCEQEDSAWACGSLGKAYRDGVGLAQDREKARALFQKACDEDAPDACEWLKKL